MKDLPASPTAKKPCTSRNSSAQIPSPQVSQASDVIDPTQMLQQITLAPKRRGEHHPDLRRSPTPPSDTSLHVSGTNDTSYTVASPEAAKQQSQMGEEGPAVTLRPVYSNAMTSIEDLATRGARYQDAATQTLLGPDLLTDTVRADLLSQVSPKQRNSY